MSRTLQTMLNGMLCLLVGCTVVMLISAYIRLSLYEEAYGFTFTRVLVHSFMIFLGVILLLAFIKVWRKRLPLLKLFIIIGLSAYVLLNYMNLDSLIAENNLERYKQTGKLDTGYIKSLSYDVIPVIIHFRSQGNTVPQVLDEYLQKKKSELAETQPWSSFNLSQSRAKQLLN